MYKAYIYNNSDKPILIVEFDEFIESNRKNCGILLFKDDRIVCFIPSTNLFFVEKIDKY